MYLTLLTITTDKRSEKVREKVVSIEAQTRTNEAEITVLLLTLSSCPLIRSVKDE